MLAPVGYIELGPSDNVALDQPLAAIELLEDVNPDPVIEEWVSIGPSIFNTFLLDTGANGVLAMATAVDDLVQTGDYQTQGKFLETGIGGYQTLDISVPYRFDYAGTSGERNTISNDTRIMSDAKKDFSMFGPWGLVGMPAMASKVTSLDMTGWSGGGVGLEDLHMKVDFADELPESNDHRYAFPVDNRISFEPGDSLIYGDPPVWADVPFLTATSVQSRYRGVGKLPCSTRVPKSVSSRSTWAWTSAWTAMATESWTTMTTDYVTSETVAGVGGEISVPVFAIDEVHVTVTHVSTGNEVELVWTDLQWLVMDIEHGRQRAIDWTVSSVPTC